MKVCVIGAGLGGLAAAAYLRRDGHDVVVVERAPIPGGRAGLIDADGFRLDNGPTVLTMPELLADVFAAAGASMDDHCPVVAVDPMYRAVYDDASVLHVRHGREAMTDEIRSFAGDGEASSFGRFCDWLAELYRVEMAHFIDRNYDTPLDLAREWRAAAALARLGGFGRLGRKVATFFRDPRLQRIFSFQSMYAGLAPYQALALYAVITYMDSVEGVFVPRGGMHRMATGLAEALERAGVGLRFGCAVERIRRRPDGAAAGVVLADGEVIEADAVVATPDLPVAYRELLDGVDAPRAARRGRFSPSCVLWVAGVRGTAPPSAAHHNIHFGPTWDESFRSIIDEGRRMTDPSFLVTLHALDDTALAPAGHTTLYVLEPVPNLDGRIDWRREGPAIVEDLRGRVAAAGYPVDAVVERVYTPEDWLGLGMARGTPFALAHTFLQSGPFRPANRDRRVPGLFFAGSGTVPGVGVPMVLISGRLAAQRVREYAGSGR